MNTPINVFRVLAETPDFVMGLLYLSEMGMSDTKIATRTGYNRYGVYELLATARSNSAWGSTKIAKDSPHEQ